MKFKDINIRTQLVAGFSVMILFVIILGVVSFRQAQKLHQQTIDMYNHPLKVRRAIAVINEDLLAKQLAFKDLVIEGSKSSLTDYLNKIEISRNNTQSQMDILRLGYLGPVKDLDDLESAINELFGLQLESVELLRKGDKQVVINRITVNSAESEAFKKVQNVIKQIDTFAKNKSDWFINSSNEVNADLTLQLIVLLVLIVIVSLIVYYRLIQNIRRPLLELGAAVKAFESGNLSARSRYNKNNEFGTLASAFNGMVGTLQNKIELDKTADSFAMDILNIEDSTVFFRTALVRLSEICNAQISAVYRLDEEIESYTLVESLGGNNAIRESFGANNYDGELGLAISTKKIQHIVNLTDEKRFSFHAVSGVIIPNELVTIPIVLEQKVKMVFSFASVSGFSAQSIAFFDYILDILTARISSVLAYKKVNDAAHRLEVQNQELDNQKNELQMQSFELREQNIQLEIQKQQLHEASKLKTVFLSNMSHELRTPLNSVIALSGVLTRRLAGKIGDEEHEYLEVIARNGKHLLSLINDILDIARIESGKTDVEFSKCNVSDIVFDLVSMIKPNADAKGILLHFDYVSDFQLITDADKFRHILQNLIANAVKFTNEGRVDVTIRQTSDSLIVDVADTGIGIAENKREVIFEEFSQADGSTSRRFGGSGLGLAIARKFAHLIGGTISLQSTVGKGSLFSLILPLNPEIPIQDVIVENKNRDTADNSNENIDEKHTYSIMLVEDSEPAIVQLRDFLNENHYNVMVANNGESALELLNTVLPDAIVLDLMMPGIDGFQLLKTIREAEATINIPVLILTAKHVTKEELSMLKLNNIHQLIQKGDVNKAALIKAVNGMLAGKVNNKPKIVLPPTVDKEKKPVVLITEDNPDNMMTIKALLDNKFEIIEAYNGQEGVDMAFKYEPDLILMDISLPVLDGIAAYKAIKSNAKFRHLPIIAVTASAMIQERETILAYGFNAYISKPIDHKNFLDTINEVLYGK